MNGKPRKKIDFNSKMEEIVSELEINGERPRLLLHACCAPCSSAVLERIARSFRITILYYNPNIHPEAEYRRRLDELKRFLGVFPLSTENRIELVEDSYNPEDFFAATRVRSEPALQNEPEKGERCRRCYLMRMRRASAFATENGFDFFTTTLSISPHKDAQKINEIGLSLESSNLCGARFLPADFKKKGGFLCSTQLSAEYGLWRQDYCGCAFSRGNRENKHNFEQ